MNSEKLPENFKYLCYACILFNCLHKFGMELSIKLFINESTIIFLLFIKIGLKLSKESSICSIYRNIIFLLIKNSPSMFLC